MKILSCMLLVTFVQLLQIQSCKKADLPKGTPDCVKDKIKALLKEDCPSVKNVYSYSFQGKTVYLFNPRDCGNDLTSEVVDEDCKNICWLGGFAGNLTCEGENFENNAKDEKLIWKNEE